MKFSDEMLMAYADGELDLVARAEIEAAMARDPEVARAVERHRALAARVHTAYDGILEEPVPERLATLASAPGDARVVGLAARRAERAAPEQRKIALGRWELPAWSAAAAAIFVGVLLGVAIARGPASPYEETAAGLVARGALAEGLSSQLASAPEKSAVHIGTTFRDRSGDYCRTFHYQRGTPTAGLACRSGEEWRIEVLAAAASQQGELRPATAMPLVVLQMVDAKISGEPFDASQEEAARDAGWR
jgi:hypothetical protein